MIQENKPTWKKGDLLAMPADLQPRGSCVSDGCAVFAAESDPVFANGRWRYVCRDAKELRPATAADLDRLLGIAQAEVYRAAEKWDRYNELRRLLVDDLRAAGGA